MCFIILPEAVVKILPVGEEDHNVTIKEDTSPGLLQWAEALASLSESESVPGLSLESEMKLAGKEVHYACVDPLISCTHFLLTTKEQSK
jgi:hypothetical protein